MYTLTYTDEYGNSYTQENVIRIDWLDQENIETVATEYLERPLTEEERQTLYYRIDKADYFPSNEDIRNIISYYIINKN